MQTPNGLRRLRQIVRDMDEVAVAYSGGVDSTLLLRIAQEELGEGAAAIVCSSDLMAPGDALDAVRTANDLGVEARVVEVELLSCPEIANNPPERCYHCKKIIFTKIAKAAESMGLEIIADGTHADDRDGDRPGIKALRELGVRSPLAEAGMNKKDIREASKELGLPTASRPPSPCLATRIPFNDVITPDKLRQVDEAERLLRELGYGQVRVRHHGNIARIEVEPRFLARAIGDREIIIDGVKAVGFTYVTLDLSGFRSGSMSEAMRRF